MQTSTKAQNPRCWILEAPGEQHPKLCKFRPCFLRRSTLICCSCAAKMNELDLRVERSWACYYLVGKTYRPSKVEKEMLASRGLQQCPCGHAGPMKLQHNGSETVHRRLCVASHLPQEAAPLAFKNTSPPPAAKQAPHFCICVVPGLTLCTVDHVRCSSFRFQGRKFWF